MIYDLPINDNKISVKNVNQQKRIKAYIFNILSSLLSTNLWYFFTVVNWGNVRMW
jgi:hypothetical protein